MRIDASKISKLNERAVRSLLRKLITKLDDLDSEDFFGTEGWRHRLLGEDT